MRSHSQPCQSLESKLRCRKLRSDDSTRALQERLPCAAAGSDTRSQTRFPKAIILLGICTELGYGFGEADEPIQQLDHSRGNGLDRSGMSQGAPERAIAAVLNGIIRISARYIRFPYDGSKPRSTHQSAIAEIAGFPQCNRKRSTAHTLQIKAPLKGNMRT
ncbi:hypothetical protein N1851_018279 [Merluccius polli]|uniref:Uncharacterized protein n=1 Tax=Merluccius polli TaxID=89951 RepID=A0AA47MP77_MERPO|nr:hypothetical protein N1851_018279 [Merluccius polli]